jgi:serine/threonine protein kinase
VVYFAGVTDHEQHRSLGRYLLLRPLGAGGSRQTFLASSADRGPLRVVKVCLPDMPDELQRRFAREARVLARVSSPAVVRLHESGQVDGRWFMALEHTAGRDLGEVLRLARAAGLAIAPALALFVVEEVVRGLHAAHERGIVHGDVAAENVILGEAGEVKLIDFGRACERGDPSVDLRAAGALLWELLVGEPAPTDRMVRPSARRAGIDPELEALLLTALAAADPSAPGGAAAAGERFRDAGAMQAALRAVRAGADGPALVTDILARLDAGDTTPADARLGSVVGVDFRLVRLCGAGRMGRVYEAAHGRFRGRFAVKILDDDYPEAVVRRLFREASDAALIPHRSVVRLLDHGRTADGAPYLVTEYIDGATVRQWLDRDRWIPVERAVEIALEVAEALAAAHRTGVVHRAVRASNVMVVGGGDEAGAVKLVDFGVSRRLEEAGTGGNRADLRRDVEALGALIVEMVTGAGPRDTTLAAGVLPPATARLVRRALGRHPLRPSVSASALAAALAGDLRGPPPGRLRSLFDRLEAGLHER